MKHKSKIIIFILLVIIFILAILSVYLLLVQKKNLQNPNENLGIQVENEIKNETIERNEFDTQNVIKENTSSNTNVTRVDLSENSTSTNSYISPTDVNLDELKSFLETYSFGIERITYNGENLESNTILLYIAKQYFDKNTNNTSSLKVDTTYASTAENMHKYLTELTGKNYSNTDYIRSYSNYIGYSSSSKAYTYGKNISDIKDEKYSCNQLVITDEEPDDTYVAKGQIVRTANEEKTIYDITLTFKINKNYTYQKYQIISLKTVNRSFSSDNTVHLVEIQEDE